MSGGATPGGGYPAPHPALIRPVLYAGVERPVVAIEGMLVGSFAANLGPRLATLAIAALVVGVIHPILARLTARDPMATAIYARSLRWRKHYPAHSDLGLRGRVVPTLPGRR